MAFFSKVGNILRQTATKQITPDLLGANSSIFQAIRCMSSSKVFIGGVSYSTDDQSLKEAFARYGEVLEARIIMDRETGRSRGFGFVTFTSSEEASSAIQALDGQELHGRRVKVNYANDRPRSNFGGDGYGYGGGGGYSGAAPTYDNNGGGRYGGGGAPAYENSGGGGYGGGGAPAYENSGGGGYGGGGSGGYEEIPLVGYSSTSSYTTPPGSNSNFTGEGGYGSTTESVFGSGGNQFANTVSRGGGFADGAGDFGSTQGNFQNADDEFGKAEESRN